MIRSANPYKKFCAFSILPTLFPHYSDFGYAKYTNRLSHEFKPYSFSVFAVCNRREGVWMCSCCADCQRKVTTTAPSTGALCVIAGPGLVSTSIRPVPNDLCDAMHLV